MGDSFLKSKNECTKAPLQAVWPEGPQKNFLKKLIKNYEVKNYFIFYLIWQVKLEILSKLDNIKMTQKLFLHVSRFFQAHKGCMGRASLGFQ